MYEHLLKNSLQALVKSQFITVALFAAVALVLIVATRARLGHK